MKSALSVVLFRLFTIAGVFVDGKEESVSVTKGHSVTLKSGFTEIQTDDEIEWKFSGSKIATISRDDGGISPWVKTDGSFKDILQLNNQTGDLKISNIRTTDSGDYKLLITSPRDPPPEMTFTVKVVSAVVSADEVKPVPVVEGDSLTLKTGLTDIQRDAVIQWRYGQQKSLVAEINRKAGIFNTYDGADGRFRDRLQLNNQTGSLNITDIRTTVSGLYEVEIISTRSSYTIHHTQSFSVTVRDDVESVSVLQGDSVTLHTGLTKIQTDDQIVWKFGDDGELFPRLNGIVNKRWSNIGLNLPTGDLNISNIQRDQSGHYKVEINTRTMILHKKYNITIIVVSADAVKSVSVLEGDSVTLHTDPTYIHDMMQWRYGQQKSLVAEINRKAGIFNTYDGADERFRGRLKLDHQTGSLTIKNIRTTDSGLYEAEIISTSSRYTRHHTQSFTVTVRGALKSLSVMKGETVTLQTNVTEIQKDDLILWMFGDIVIAEIHKADRRFSTYDGPNERFRDRLKLDHQTGSLTITNTRTTHSGLYEVKISSSRHIINRRIFVTVTDPVLYPATIALIVVGVLLVAAAAAVVIYCCNKISRPKLSWKRLLVVEGETVPLHPHGTEISKEDHIQWKFKDTVIAERTVDGKHNEKFLLDKCNGSLNISNIKSEDTGLYELQINRLGHLETLEIFSVTVYAKTEIKIKEVKKGGSVTLESGVTGIQKDDEILWKFALDYRDIAAIQEGRKKISPFGAGWRYIFRLKLDENGSLTIKNIRPLDTGFYVLYKKISGTGSLNLFSVKIFNPSEPEAVPLNRVSTS